MNGREHLAPPIAVSSEGYRELRPNQGDGHRNIMSAKVRSLLSNALGVKKFTYVACRNMPKDPTRNGTFHVCVEGLFEAQKKRERLHPEVLHIGVQMGANFGPEYCKFYKERFVDVVNGQLRNKSLWNNVKEWLGKSRASTFCSGVGQITDDARNYGTQYDPNFDLNAMDD